MCMKNINITGTLFKKITLENDFQSFEMPFDTIVAKTNNNTLYIDDFSIVLNYCLMGTNKTENLSSNIVNQKGKLYTLLRLSKVSRDESKQLSVDLSEFVIDLSDPNLYISHACVDYVTFRKIFSVTQINLDKRAGLGEYVLKILVRTDENDMWNVQSYIPLRIE